MSDQQLQYYGTGRRKSSTARVYLRPGKGEFTVNKRSFENYFSSDMVKMIIRQPLAITETGEKFDIYVRVSGGGSTGQAGCVVESTRGVGTHHQRAVPVPAASVRRIVGRAALGAPIRTRLGAKRSDVGALPGQEIQASEIPVL